MEHNIFEIEKLYPSWYNKEFSFSFDDQKFIWENMPLSEEDEIKLREIETSENVSVNGSVNGSCKNVVNSWLNLNRLEVISKLKVCSSETPEQAISSFLEKLFEPWSSFDGHWLYIAQTYTPRVISWVISCTVKRYLRGGIKKTPAHYFTHEIKYRTKRKTKHLIGTNGNH